MGVDIHITAHDAIYVPECPVCLLSPQQVAQQTETVGDGFNAKAPSGILQIGGYQHIITYNQKSSLPILYTGSLLGDPTANITTYHPASWEPPYTAQKIHTLNEELIQDGSMHHNLSKVQLQLLRDTDPSKAGLLTQRDLTVHATTMCLLPVWKGASQSTTQFGNQ